MDTLVVIYKNVGEKVRNDILKRGLQFCSAHFSDLRNSVM